MSYHRYTGGVVLALLLGTLFSCSNGVPSTDAGVTTVTSDPGSTSTVGQRHNYNNRGGSGSRRDPGTMDR